MKKIGCLIAATACGLLVACSGTSGSDVEGGSKINAAHQTTKAPSKPKFDGKAYAAKAEKDYTDQLGQSIKKGCNTEHTAWQCFYDGLTAKGESRIDINLSTPGEISASEAKAFSKKARLAWFNFIGADFKKLRMIVTFVNGRDTGTTNRSDVPLLNR